MKKLIIAVLSISLSFILVVPAHAVDSVSDGELISFLSLLYNSQNCTLVAYNSSTPSASACDSSGAFMTQKVDYEVLRSLYNSVAIEGVSIVQQVGVSGQFRWLSYGGYCWIQFLSDYAPNNGYCGNSLRKILYCDAPSSGNIYTTSAIAGAPGYFVTARPRGTSGSGYLGDLAIPQANYMTILNSLQSLGGSAMYYSALATVDGETRYYMSCTYPSRVVTYVCNSSGQLYYYVKEPAAGGGDSGGGTVVAPFDDTAVITAINSVYSAVTSLGSRIGTLINSVDTISQNFAVHMSNFVTAIMSLRDDIDGFRMSMEYTFAEFTQLYPSDASMTLSSGDTLDWNSAYKQDPVSHFENTPTTSPIIYATGINGFSGNAVWENGTFTLTPSTGTYFPQTVDVGGIPVEMPSHVVSTAVPNAAFVVPDGYSQYTYLQSDGSEYIDTGRSGAVGSTYHLRLGYFTNTAVNQAVWGAFYGSNNRPLEKYLAFAASDKSIYLNYTTYNYGKIAVVPSTDYDVSITPSSSGFTFVLNGVSKTTGGYTISSGGKTLYLFGANGLGYGARYRLYAYDVTAGGSVVQNLVPCSNPSGDVGLYDTVAGVFHPKIGSGSFVCGDSIPAMIGEDIIDYYNISSIYRGGMVGDYYYWYAVDSEGNEHLFPESDCRQLDSCFSAYSFNSIDTFVPQEGSYVVSWDDSETGDIVIDYKSMSRFFSWLYRFLNNQQLFMQNTVVPALQDTGGSVSQSINTTINNITVNDNDTFYNVYNFGDGENIVDAGKDGINKVGGLLRWLWGNTFKGAFENVDVGSLDGLFATYSDVYG